MPTPKEKPDAKTPSKDGSNDVVKSNLKRMGRVMRSGWKHKESSNSPELQDGHDLDRSFAEGSPPQQEQQFGHENWRMQGRKQSFRPDTTIPPLSPKQNYLPEEGYEGMATTVVSDQSQSFTSEAPRQSEESFVPDLRDPFTLGADNDHKETFKLQELSNGNPGDSEQHNSVESQICTRQTPTRKPVVNPSADPGHPLPPVPSFNDAIRTQFHKESQISVSNSGDKGLVAAVVEEVISIASREMQLREEYANQSRQKGDFGESQKTIADLQSSIVKYNADASAKDTAIGNLRALRLQDKTTIDRKESELLNQSQNLRALEEELRNCRKDLADHEVMVRESNVEIQRLANLQTEASVLERSYKNKLLNQKKELVDGHEQKIQDLKSSHQQRIQDIESRHALSITDLKETHAMRASQTDEAHRQVVSNLRTQHNNVVSEKDRTHVVAVSTLEEQINKIKLDMTGLIVSHKEAMSQNYQKYKDEISKRQSEYDEDLDELTKEIEAIKSRSDRTEKDLRSAHDNERSEMIRKHDEAQEGLIAKHEEAREALIGQHEGAREQFEKDKENMEAAKTLALDSLVEEHKAERAYLQRQVQDLNTALLNRDEEEYRGTLFKSIGLPKKSDEKLRELFGEIQHMVEDLGRLSWKPKQNLWTEGIIARVQGKNVLRVLKKAILQDLVWSLLFQAIFASPFRIFGDEGAALEKEWFEQCSQDPPAATDKFPWPAPGAHAERWRYMTMRECREALTKPASGVDPRTRLREGFVNSVEKLSAQLKKELGSMVDLEGEHSQTVDKLSKRAAAIWLDFEMHRCRILVQLSAREIQSSQEKIAQLQSRGPLMLTVLPRLGRYGTTKGTELDRFMIVDGCGGDSLKIQ